MISSPTRSPRSFYRAGFTLIELLTVIAIIGILAAILIPTVSSVRDKAKSMRCTAKIRTWGQAVRLMANDFKGNIPLTLNVGTPTDGQGPGKLYSSYLGSLRVSGSDLNLDLSMDSMDYYSTCPGLDRSGDASNQANDTRRSYSFLKPYGAKRVTGGVMFGRSNITVDYYNVSTASTPTRLILMVEAKHPATSGCLDCTSAGNYASALETNVKPILVKTEAGIDVRHRGNSNVLFLDGSVKSMKAQDYVPSFVPPAQKAALAPYYTL